MFLTATSGSNPVRQRIGEKYVLSTVQFTYVSLIFVPYSTECQLPATSDYGRRCWERFFIADLVTYPESNSGQQV